MKQTLSIAFLMLIVVASTEYIAAQVQCSDKVIAKQTLKKVKVDPAGFITLPEGLKAFRTEGFIDAWFGYVESDDGKFKVNFSAGLVESLFDKYKSKFEWTKTEQTSNTFIKFGLMRIKKAELLVARIGWIEFSVPIKRESDKEIFMGIVHSYRREKCDDCRSLPFKK